jgi:hypothetical protein
MAHITSIGAGLFSDLSVCVDATQVSDAFATPTEANFKLAFANAVANGVAPSGTASGEFIRIRNVREFPAMGTPPNVVNIAVYGQKSSQQIQGQSDSPSIEITLNYVGTDWQKTPNFLGIMVGDGVRRLFRFTLLNAEPTTGVYSSAAAGLGSTENSQYFWFGKIEALLVTPQLTDANTATVTITVQSDFYGAFTSNAA